MSGNSGFYVDRDERRRLRREERDRRHAMKGQCDSLAHAVRGPITLITIGALFAVNNFTPYGFDKTWPVILIVFGLLTLVGRSTAQPLPPAAAAASAPSPEAPPPPLPDIDSTAPGGYRQSTYSQTQEEGRPGGPPHKGGFGTSAPPPQPGGDA